MHLHHCVLLQALFVAAIAEASFECLALEIPGGNPPIDEPVETPILDPAVPEMRVEPVFVIADPANTA